MERFSGCSVGIGIAIILCGCFYAVALHNPGGPPPMALVRQRADAIARWSCGVGAAVAIGYPMLAMLMRFRKPKPKQDASSSNNSD